MTWRWACKYLLFPLFAFFIRLTVYMNIPISFAAFLVLALSLRGVETKKPYDASWRTLRDKFDFIGLSVFYRHSLHHI